MTNPRKWICTNGYPEKWHELLQWRHVRHAHNFGGTITKEQFMKEVDETLRNREYQQRYRQRKKELGKVRIDLYVHQRHRQLFKRLERLAEENRGKFTRKAVEEFCKQVEEP